MKVTILNDNIASSICDASHGLSYYIEADINILFDAGPSDIAIKNAKKIGIEPNNNKYIVLSHGHWDHANGLKYLHSSNIVAHPEIFRKRYKLANKKSIGIDISKTELERKFKFTLTKKPLKLSNELVFLGEIPKTNNWDTPPDKYFLKDGSADLIPDDSALVAFTNTGMIIISGCAHSGITNIISYAMKLYPNKRLESVIGGFHLKPNDARIDKTIEFLKAINLKKAYPSHCTSSEVIATMYNQLPIGFVKSGNIFKF